MSEITGCMIINDNFDDEQRAYDSMEPPEYLEEDPEPFFPDQDEFDSISTWPDEYFDLASKIAHMIAESEAVIVGESGQGYASEELTALLIEYQEVIRKHVKEIQK